jgi:hypothetical protein
MDARRDEREPLQRKLLGVYAWVFSIDCLLIRV